MKKKAPHKEKNIIFSMGGGGPMAYSVPHAGAPIFNT